MKCLFFLILSTLVLNTGIASADVYVVTDRNNAVYSISPQNDAVIPSGYTLTVLKGQNMQNLPISGNPQLYNFSKGAFTLNNTAVTADQATLADAIARANAAQQAKLSALAKLTDAISKVAPADVLTDQELNALLPS